MSSLPFPLSKPSCLELSNHALYIQSVLEHILASGIPGDIAEFGVHAGDNMLPMCRLLQHRNSEKLAWAYDTFQGLPFGEEHEDGINLEAGECYTPKHVFWKRMQDEGVSKRINMVEGMVEDTLLPEREETFAFAFIDLDLESSCRHALAWITPRMPKGAIFGIHDYGHPKIPGPEKICHELEAESQEWNRWGPIFGNACFFVRL